MTHLLDGEKYLRDLDCTRAAAQRLKRLGTTAYEDATILGRPTAYLLTVAPVIDQLIEDIKAEMRMIINASGEQLLDSDLYSYLDEPQEAGVKK